MSQEWPLPTISIIIATFNRPQSLQRVLDHIAKQVHFNFDQLDIGIVNDGSTVSYDDVDFGVCPCPVEYVYRERAGVTEQRPNGLPQVYSSRNMAVSKTKGEVLYFLDDDLYFMDHTLCVLQLYHSIQDNILLIAHEANRGAPHYYPMAFAVRTQGPTGWTTTRGLSVRRKWFEQVGGFDADFDLSMGFADRDLGIRLVDDAGCDVWQANGITVFGDDSETNGSLRDWVLRDWVREHPNDADHRNGVILWIKHPETAPKGWKLPEGWKP